MASIQTKFNYAWVRLSPPVPSLLLSLYPTSTV